VLYGRGDGAERSELSSGVERSAIPFALRGERGTARSLALVLRAGCLRVRERVNPLAPASRALRNSSWRRLSSAWWRCRRAWSPKAPIVNAFGVHAAHHNAARRQTPRAEIPRDCWAAGRTRETVNSLALGWAPFTTPTERKRAHVPLWRSLPSRRCPNHAEHHTSAPNGAPPLHAPHPKAGTRPPASRLTRTPVQPDRPL
jgi:hypothetical protein